MKIGTKVVLNKSYKKIILKMSWLPLKNAEVSKQFKNKQNQDLYSNSCYFWPKKYFSILF